jgi:hypothetical protein
MRKFDLRDAESPYLDELSESRMLGGLVGGNHRASGMADRNISPCL